MCSCMDHVFILHVRTTTPSGRHTNASLLQPAPTRSLRPIRRRRGRNGHTHSDATREFYPRVLVKLLHFPRSGTRTAGARSRHAGFRRTQKMRFCGVSSPDPRWIYTQDRVAAPDSCRFFIARRGVFLHQAGPQDGDGG